MTYTLVGEISEACREYLLAQVPAVVQVGGEGQDANYQSSPRIQPLSVLDHPELKQIPFDRCNRSFVVGVKPQGHLHVHTHDLDRDQSKTRYHVVLETNDECICRNGDEVQHLADLGIYRMEPYLEHEAWNYGTTNRLHLILVTDDV